MKTSQHGARIITVDDGWIDGIALFTDDAEGGPADWTVTAPAALSIADNHTPAGSMSYYMSSDCWAGNEPSCDGLSPCNDTCAALTLNREVILPEGAMLTFRSRASPRPRELVGCGRWTA